MFKIDKGIPMPEVKGQKHRIYPLEEMEIGDSFFVPGRDADRVLSAARTTAKKLGIKLRGRTIKEEPYGARIWRVE